MRLAVQPVVWPSPLVPSLVIVGRPNVGKSSLFNCWTQTRLALVADYPGLTRDRLYGRGEVGTRPYLLIDTGGLVFGNRSGIEEGMYQQVQRAIQDADVILFVVDGRAGLMLADELLAKQLRRLGKPIHLVINKSEGLDASILKSEFAGLGFADPATVSATHREGIAATMDGILAHLSSFPTFTLRDHPTSASGEISRIRVAISGKPNVGKSTLLNRILGEERVLVFDQPGTTRDSTAHDFNYRGQGYTLTDTAGIRRKSKTEEGVEAFSVVKSLQAIESSHVVLLLIDATVGITDQDLHLLGFVLEAGKALVIAVNKWDGLTPEQRAQLKQSLDRRLQFVQFAKIVFISALHGTGVGHLFGLIQRAYRSATRPLTTSSLTRLLNEAVLAHQPPASSGRAVKLRYAHPGGYNPPLILIHGQHTRTLPESYRRYLENFYHGRLHLVGSPIRIEFRDR